MKKAIIIGSIFLILLYLVVPYVLKAQIEHALPIKIDSVFINYLKKRITVNGLDFQNDPQEKTQVKLTCHEIIFDIDTTEHFKQVTVDGFKMWIGETHQVHPHPPSQKDLALLEQSFGGKVFESLPQVKIDNITLNQADFYYTLKIFGKDANLDVENINAQISAVGTRRDEGSRYTFVNLTGRLQKTGKMELRVKADLYSVKNEDQIDLTVKEQKLNELDTFFFVEDGIKMKGMIDLGEARMDLRRGKLSGNLKVSYEDFEMSLSPTPDHGKFATWIAGMIEKFKFEKSKDGAVAEIKYQRKPDQSVINLLLQGMKEAVLKAAAR